MPVELEAKIKVETFDAVRERLCACHATRVGSRLELNAFFDTPERLLKSRDQGLRLRQMTNETGDVACVATFKGSQAGGDGRLKQREEIEFSVGDFEAASAMFERLGYSRRLAFEKRRETFELHGCLVELDELPHLGRFVEVEGETADAIHATLAALMLSSEAMITRGYIGMMSDLVRKQPTLGLTVRF